MWGVVGIFLAVPLTVLLRMGFEQFEPLRPLAIMMSGVDRKTAHEARAAQAVQEVSKAAKAVVSPSAVTASGGTTAPNAGCARRSDALASGHFPAMEVAHRPVH